MVHFLCDRESGQIQAPNYRHWQLASAVLDPLHLQLWPTGPQHCFDISMTPFVFSTIPPHLYCKWSYTSGFPKPAILSWGSREGCVFLSGICGLPDICWFPYPNRHPRSRFCTRCPERPDMDPGTQAALNEQEGREVKGFRGVALSLNCREKQMHKLFPWPLLAQDRPLLEQGQFFSIERGNSSVGTICPLRLQQESLWCTWALIFTCLYFLTANEL